MVLQISFFGIFQSATVFLAFTMVVITLLTAFSKKMTVVAYSGYMVFVYIALNADISFYNNLLYIVMVILVVYIGLNAVSIFTGSDTA